MKKFSPFLLSLSLWLTGSHAIAHEHASTKLSPSAVELEQALDQQQQQEANHESNIVVLKTNRGDIVIELAEDKAPVSVANFKRYVADGFYDGTIFHRVIAGFMIQGGGFDNNMLKKTTHAPIKNEADNGLKNVVGSIAMARTNDPNSATSQFFINVNDNRNLNHTAKNPRGWGYAVFGQVIDGLDIVMAISQAETSNKGRYQNVPVEDIVIEKAMLK